jgi:DNA-directed RNA polymerase specialized sigma subunit
VSVGRSQLSKRQWEDVIAARPELAKLSERLSGRCPRFTPDEILTLGEDVLIHEVPRWDRSGETSLVGYALRRIRRAVYEAAARRAGRSAGKAVAAMAAHGATVLPLELSELTQLSPEQLLAYAQGLGRDQVAVGHSAYTIEQARTAASPEELLSAAQQREQLWSAVDEAGPEAAALYRRVYEGEQTLDEAAVSLGINVFAAKRLHARARGQVRAILERKRR